MKTIRILSLVLALLMLALPLAACKDKTTGDDPADETEQEVVTLKLVTDGVSNYDIVYDGDKTGSLTRGAVNALVSAYQTFLGCEINVRESFSERDDAQDEEVRPNEILVGMTSRPESVKAMEGKRSSDYSVTIDGGKLVIAGGSDEATMTAITRFLTAFVHEQGDKAEVAAGKKLSMVATTETVAPLSFVGRYSFSKTVLCDARVDSYCVVYPANTDVPNAKYSDFANTVQAHVFKEAGYEIKVYNDENIVRADYMILVGDTKYTDPEVLSKMGAGSYHIELKKTETGAYFIIHYGEKAKDAALAAFKEILPASAEPIEIELAEGVLKTNIQ